MKSASLRDIRKNEYHDRISSSRIFVQTQLNSLVMQMLLIVFKTAMAILKWPNDRFGHFKTYIFIKTAFGLL